MNLPAAIETGTTGLWYGRITTLMGTHARAQSKEQLLRELEDEARYHVDWLRRHGVHPPHIVNPVIQVVEEASGVAELGESGGEVAFFRSDLAPVSDKLLKECIRLMGFNRLDILRQVDGLPQATMRHVPEGKGRNIEKILMHVCNAEEWYLSRLGGEADALYEVSLGRSVAEVDDMPLFQRLEAVRKAVVEVLLELVPSKNGVVLTRAEYTSHPGERWTTMKVLRRYLEHEREHIYNIREYLGLPPRGPVLKP